MQYLCPPFAALWHHITYIVYYYQLPFDIKVECLILMCAVCNISSLPFVNYYFMGFGALCKTVNILIRDNCKTKMTIFLFYVPPESATKISTKTGYVDNSKITDISSLKSIYLPTLT